MMKFSSIFQFECILMWENTSFLDIFFSFDTKSRLYDFVYHQINLNILSTTTE